ncbi:DUF4112 domain-containing protein [Marivita sp. GX14005]|uniref:DUF4112 domain-containing protein n=1 Tax=Marivita sp. GX14005 TaxID=2942276 RepID=UPI0020184FB4|nr:DUF4112 domain-containing protein [Marivita sp. GX14005]MCL3880730.1 DUF4112 domain-containing protein [Marivita sp. GX14005]
MTAKHQPHSLSEPANRGTAPGRQAALPVPDGAERLARLERIATTLDSRFRVPGIGLRIGWDSILGLIPGLGDAVTVLPAGYFLYEGYRMGARRRVLARMGLNSGIDFLVGSVPLVGDLFDAGFKANLRNIALLKAEMQHKVTQSSNQEVSHARTS